MVFLSKKRWIFIFWKFSRLGSSAAIIALIWAYNRANSLENCPESPKNGILMICYHTSAVECHQQRNIKRLPNIYHLMWEEASKIYRFLWGVNQHVNKTKWIFMKKITSNLNSPRIFAPKSPLIPVPTIQNSPMSESEP